MQQSFACRIILYLTIFGLVPLVPVVFPQTAPGGKPANTPAQNHQEALPLEPGKPIEREMKGGEQHSYHLTLNAGQLLHAVVDQRGIDVVVTLFDPEGKPIVQMDGPNANQGPEPIWAIAEIAGSYRLEVRSLEKDAKPGRYEARIAELRIASQQDRNRVTEERAFIEAEELRAQGGAVSLRRAIAKYEESLQMSQAAGDRSGEARALNSIGLVHNSLGEKPKAFEYYNRALSIRRAIGDRSGEATTLNNLGRVHDSLGEPQKALDYYDHALPLLRAVGERSVEATTLNNIGAVYNSLGEKRKALEYFNQALLIRRALQNHSGEATILNNMGAVYDDLGEKQKALDYYNQSLKIFQALGDRSGEATTLNNIGFVYNSLGEREKALKYLNQVLLLFQAAGDPSGEAKTLNNIGSVYNSLGEKQKALNYYNQALTLKRTVGDRSGEATSLNNIGLVYSLLGEKQKALDYYNQALALKRTVGDQSGEATTLNNIGRIYESLGQKPRAIDYFNQALLIFRALRDRSGEATTLNNIGAVYDSLGELKAIDYFNQALPIFRSLGDRPGEAATLHNIGALYDSLGDKQKALDYYKQALPIFRAIGDRSSEVTILSNTGLAYESLGDKHLALDSYQQSIAMLESLRAAATIEEIKTGLSGQSASSYQRAMLLLMQSGKQTDAFDLTEHARARTFLDQMGNIRPRQHNITNAQLIQEEQTLASELTSLEQKFRQGRSRPVSSLKTEELSSLENQLAVKQRRYEDLFLRLKLANPEYVSLRSIDTFTLPEVQKLLNRDTTLISYFVTPEKTLAFIISRSEFRAVELPVKEADLTNSINWFRGFANLRNPRPESLKQLYGWLIAPLSQHIHTRTVGIIPHGVLHYLPFAALTGGQHYFGDDHTLFHLPSASVLSFIQQKSKPVGTQILSIAQSHAEGLPVLQYADEEAQTVASLYNTQALTSRKASKSSFLKRAGECSILHIAAHAVLNTSNPLFSQITMGADKDATDALEVREVYDLDLSKASLVVLSACETQLGAQSKGDDIVGLTRAFIYAGTPTVIASLWTVDDESTSYLMKAFYTHLKGGMSKAAALQAAQSDTRKKYPHPYYWAGFVLTGDPGQSTKKQNPH